MRKLLLTLTLLFVVFLAKAQTVIYHENFELPSNADSVTALGATANFSINSRIAHGGLQCDSNFVSVNDTAFLTTSSFSTIGLSYVFLNFSHICKIDLLDAGEIQLSIDNGASWVTLTGNEYINTNGSQFITIGNKFTSNAYPTLWLPLSSTAKPTNTWWKTEMFNISAIAGNRANVKIRFALRDGNNNGASFNHGWFIDDIFVTGALSELTPPTVNYAPPLVQDTIFNTGPFVVTAWIKDASGIDTAYISYKLNNGPSIYVPMVWISDSTYKGTIPQYTYNNRIDYFIHAVDNSASHNSANGIDKWFYIKKGPSSVIIGTGTSTSNFPFNELWGYGRSATIYTSSEINKTGIVNSLKWNVTGTASANCPVKIYLKTTTDNSFTTASTWSSLISGATLVYSGTVNFAAAGWKNFALSTPYTYTSGNLVVLCESNYGGGGVSPYATFKYTTSTQTNTHQYFTADNTPPTGTGSRNANRPNITINFNSSSLHADAGAAQIVSPTGTILANANSPVNVIITNFGLDTLKKATIAWKLDGVLQSSYPWVGAIPEAINSPAFFIGNVNVGLGAHTLKIWTESPNDSIDNNHTNDTVTGSFFACSSILNGTYTIGSSGDFHTFAEALTALGNCGINGPVIFQVASGTYTEQLNLPSINGISATNTVTFQSASGNPADVTVQFAATTTANNYVIKLDGSKYLTFKNMTLQSNGTTYGNVIYYTNNAQYINFIGNKIKGVVTTATTNDLSVIYSPAGATATDNYISFTGNTFENGSYGINISGVGTAAAQLENGTIINNNTFTNQSLYGIYLYYQNASTISGNTFATTSTNAAFNAIMVNYCDNNSKVTKNLITLTNGGYGIYAKYCDGINGSLGLIANNAISIGGSNAAYGIYCEYNTYQNVFYNSVNIYANNTNANALYITGGSSYYEHKVKNNNLTYLGSNTAGKAYYVGTPSMVNASNYNNIYSTGTNVGYCGTNCTTLATWKTNFSRDTNSVSVNPAFVSNTNLHTYLSDLNAKATPIALVTDDLEGNPRNASTPDIGAYEFNPPAKNMGMVSILQPQSSCALSANAVVTVRIKNFGSSSIDTTQVYYQVNGGSVVHETVYHTILPDSSYNYSFTQTTNLSTPGNYTFKAYLHATGDLIPLNDTLYNYTIYSGYNFNSAPYTQGFEPTDYYGNWSNLDVNADTYTWTFPYNTTTDAHSGSNCARLATGTTNPGNDWLFSRCFSMFSGNTYKIEYWYKVSSASSPQIIELKVGNNNTVGAMTTTLQSLVSIVNTTYQKATVNFTPTTSGTYYFGWWGHSIPNSAYSFIDDINISVLPPQEASIENIRTPNTGCGLSSAETIQIKVKNTGGAPINGNLMGYYKVDNGSVVSQAITNNIAIGDTLLFSFSTPADLSVTTTDHIFTIKSWIALPGDPLAYNDTTNKSVISYHVPAVPVVSNQTIPWGSSTTLNAVSADSVFWYNSMSSTTPLAISHHLTTPALYNNTVYYTEAALFTSNIISTVGTGTSVQSYPFNTYWHDSKTQMIYTASEISAAGGGLGTIEKIAFDVTFVATQAMNGFTIQMQNTSLNNLTGFVSTGWTTVYSGTFAISATGWQEIVLQTPFQYDGSSNLLINICFDNTGYTSATTVNCSAAANKTWTQYQDASAGCSFVDGAVQTDRPNIKLTQSKKGCSSARISDTVFMSLFPYEAGIVSIPQPIDGCIGDNAFVTIRIRNNGGNPLTNIPAYYKVDGSAPVAETITATIQPNDTLTYTFITPIVTGMSTSNQDSTYNIKAYIAHPSDPNVQNDTITKSVNLLYTPPAPVVTSITIPYGTSTILHATSNDSVFWYNAPTGGTELGHGLNFTTPTLYSNAVYWVEAKTGSADVKITEVTHYNGGTGTTAPYPSWVTGSDFIEISNLGSANINLQNYTMNIYGEGARSYTFPSVIIGAGQVCVLHVGTGTDDASHLFFNMGGGNDIISSSSLSGFALKDPTGVVIDAVASNGYTFTVANGVTSADWSGSINNISGFAGPIRTISDNNTGADWVVSSGTTLQTIGYPNPGLLAGVGGSGCSSARVADSVYISLFPVEASLVNIIAPVTGCTDGTEEVTIKIKNNGTNSINNIPVSYQINPAPAVTETVSTTILSGDSLIYTFIATFPAGLTFLNTDSTYQLTAWLNVTGDPMQTNDTLHKTFILNYTPPVPGVSNISIPFGTSGTLTATSNDTVFWYDVPAGGNSIHTGLNFVTPTLFGTTVYYAESAIFVSGVQSIIGTGTSTVGYPFYTYYHDSKTQMIYTAAEIAAAGGGVGAIEKIAFNVISANSAAMNGFTIQMQQTSASSLTGFVSTGWTNVYSGNFIVPGTGWQDITLQTPFFYDGSSNLLINICFDNSAYTSNSTVYATAAAGMTWHQYSDNAAGCAFNLGSVQTDRPNIRFTQSLKGCPSARVADTVFVTGVPPCDIALQSIPSPNTGTLLSANEVVKVHIKNQGSATATNIPISYKINNLAPVTESIPGPLVMNDTLTYSFATHANLSAIQSYQIQVYSGLICDTLYFNDTLVKSVTNNSLVYCTSIPSYTSDEEIFSVSVNGSTNAYDCSTVAPGPGSILNRYSNFTTLAPLTTLSMGIPAQFTILEDECDGPTYYSNGVGIWIDLNRDGDFTDANEAVFIEPTTTYGPRTVTGTITVPNGSFNGVTTMRIICAESYSGAGLQPCMTYSYGETEDYLIRLSPPIPHDAGGVSFYQPTTYQDEGMNVPVKLIIKNFGTDTIKNSSNMQVAYQYASNPVQSVLWSGGILPPFVTDTVDLPNLTILPGNQSLCGWTVLPGDSNAFNDTTCTTIIGTPQHDAGVTNILTPGTQLIQGSSEVVSLVFKNYGADTITSLNLSYKVNNVVQATELWTGILLPSLSQTFTFTQPFTVPASTFDLCAYTQLVGDPIHTNDTSCISPFGVFTSSLPYYENFDGSVVSFSQTSINAGTTWQLGTPSYTTTNSAHSAPNAWDINLNSVYTSSASATLYTQNFDFSNATSAKLKFWINYDVESSWDGCRIDYSIDTGTTWQTLGIMNDPLGTNWYNDDLLNSSSQPGWTGSSNGWIESEYKLSVVDSVPVVRFRFVFTSDGSGEVSGVSIDDFSITIPSAQDAGVTNIIEPSIQAQAGSTKVVQIKIKNFGLDTLFAIPVSYVVNGGIPVAETWTGTLAPDSVAIYNFSMPFIVPSGQFSLCSYTGLANDGDHLNDTTCTTITGIPTFAVPHSDDFEGTVYMFTSGTLWEWGVPNASTINSAHSPTHAWATNLDGDYTNNATEYLYSPLYDFSTVDSAYMEFYHWYNTEASADGGNIQYSKDGGTTWITLGLQNDPLGENWYNSLINGSPYWTGNSGGYVHAKFALHKLTGNPILTATGPVQFRFKFISNGSTSNYNGWAVDDFSITAPPIPNDAGVISILQPTGSTQTGAQITVGVTIKNFGTDPITSTSIRYVSYVNGVAGAVTSETWTGNLLPGDTTNYTFSTTYSSPGTAYDLCAFTVLSGDSYFWNDSTCTYLTTTPGAKDVGVTKILLPNTDTTIYQTPVTVKVTIKNFGFSTETNIPVVYSINSVQQGVGYWTGTLNPGDTTVFEFPTTFSSPLAYYVLCAKTQLVGDVNIANDQICKTMYGDTAIGINEFDATGFGLMQNQPNPCVDKTEIVYFVPSDGSVVLEFTDILGNIISRKEMDAISGKNIYEYNVRNLADGVYFYTLTYKDIKITRRMVVAK